MFLLLVFCICISASCSGFVLFACSEIFGYWKKHRQFLLGLKKYGKGDWRNISRNFVTTRTPTQVASHAQKYFIRQLTGGKDKRRSSIHDITMVNLQETKSPSSDTTRPSSPLQNQKLSSMVKQEYDWKSPCDDMPFVFNSTNANMFMAAPLHGISSYESRPQEHNILRQSPWMPVFTLWYQCANAIDATSMICASHSGFRVLKVLKVWIWTLFSDVGLLHR